MGASNQHFMPRGYIGRKQVVALLGPRAGKREQPDAVLGKSTPIFREDRIMAKAKEKIKERG